MTTLSIEQVIQSILANKADVQDAEHSRALASILKEWGIDGEVPELRNHWQPGEPILHVAECRKDLNDEEWQPCQWDDEQETRCIFLGTIMGLSPSGKVYAPWSSNVSEAEAAIDEAWREQLEKEASAMGCFIESGEGDPCDLFLCESRDAEQPETDDQ